MNRARRARRGTRCGALVLVAGLVLMGCGDDEDAPSGASPPPTVTVTETAPSTSGDDSGAAPAGNVSRRRAIAIARERVGGGRVDGVERGEDDGRAVWEVELARAGGVEHEVSVAVGTGRVVDVETDRDRDDDD